MKSLPRPRGRGFKGGELSEIADLIIGDVGRDVCFNPNNDLRKTFVQYGYTTKQEAEKFYKLLTGKISS